VLRGACPNLERELRRYRKKTHFINGLSVVSDEPNTRGEVHACQCMEYLAATEPKYRSPPKKDESDTTPEWIINYIARKTKNRAGACVYLGPESDAKASSEEATNVEQYEWV
jgi:hypothetical protein